MAAIAERGRQPNTTEGAEPITLKERLEEHLATQRKPGQMLRITQVGTRHFRVNWLAQNKTDTRNVMGTYRMIDSQFVRVDEVAGELVVTNQTRN